MTENKIIFETETEEASNPLYIGVSFMLLFMAAFFVTFIPPVP